MEAVITSQYYRVVIYPLLRNPTQYKRAKSSRYVNQGNDKTRTQKPLIPRRKHAETICQNGYVFL